MRAVAGPTVYDRILAVNAFGTKTILLIAVINNEDMPARHVAYSMFMISINVVGTVTAMLSVNAQV